MYKNKYKIPFSNYFYLCILYMKTRSYTHKKRRVRHPRKRLTKHKININKTRRIRKRQTAKKITRRNNKRKNGGGRIGDWFKKIFKRNNRSVAPMVVKSVLPSGVELSSVGTYTTGRSPARVSPPLLPIVTQKLSNRPKIHRVIYNKNDNSTHFDVMIENKELFGDALFIFNDNIFNHNTNILGSGNAIIRPYNIYGNTKKDPNYVTRAAGISTGPHFNSLDTLIQIPTTPSSANLTVKNYIDKDIEEIKKLLNSHNYTDIYFIGDIFYPDMIGTNIFTVGNDVKKYIQEQIYTLGIPCSNSIDNLHYHGDVKEASSSAAASSRENLGAKLPSIRRVISVKPSRAALSPIREGLIPSTASTTRASSSRARSTRASSRRGETNDFDEKLFNQFIDVDLVKQKFFTASNAVAAINTLMSLRLINENTLVVFDLDGTLVKSNEYDKNDENDEKDETLLDDFHQKQLEKMIENLSAVGTVAKTAIVSGRGRDSNTLTNVKIQQLKSIGISINDIYFVDTNAKKGEKIAEIIISYKEKQILINRVIYLDDFMLGVMDTYDMFHYKIDTHVRRKDKIEFIGIKVGNSKENYFETFEEEKVLFHPLAYTEIMSQKTPQHQLTSRF